jgi:hypothetical protein
MTAKLFWGMLSREGLERCRRKFVLLCIADEN